MTTSAHDVPRRFTLGPGAALKRAVTEAHKVLSDLVASDMADLGLTIGEADVLTVVHVADYPPVPGEIADWLDLTGAGLTGRLNKLERRRLIERRPHASDGRSVTIHLTDEGAGLAGAVVAAKDSAVMTTVVEHLGVGPAGELTAALDAVTALARDMMSVDRQE